MTIDHPLISREELKSMAADLITSEARIGEVLQKLDAFESTEVLSTLTPADQQAFKCVTLITTKILDDVKLQFKGKRKPKQVN